MNYTDNLELITTTCKVTLTCHLNLKLIANKLQLDDIIVGKKMFNVIEEGIIKKKNKKDNLSNHNLLKFKTK